MGQRVVCLRLPELTGKVPLPCGAQPLLQTGLLAPISPAAILASETP